MMLKLLISKKLQPYNCHRNTNIAY